MSTGSPLGEWNPGLDDTVTLDAACDKMPGDDAATVPWYVRLLENPASPIALPGAVDLFGHDCIHILLGRGMLPQDEAFVIGVTMGASGTLAAWQHRLYTLCARYMYYGSYRFSRTDLLVFDMGVEFAKHSGIRPLHDVPWRDLLDHPLGELRASLGIDTSHLTALYDGERALWPRSVAAQRLPRRSSTVVARDADASAPV